MKVNLATHLLSESVSIGILIMGQLNKFKDNMGEKWYSTSMFRLNMNRAFDSLNSSKES